jgi:hypothetical protein
MLGKFIYSIFLSSCKLLQLLVSSVYFSSPSLFFPGIHKQSSVNVDWYPERVCCPLPIGAQLHVILSQPTFLWEEKEGTEPCIWWGLSLIQGPAETIPGLQLQLSHILTLKGAFRGHLAELMLPSWWPPVLLTLTLHTENSKNVCSYVGFKASFKDLKVSGFLG